MFALLQQCPELAHAPLEGGHGADVDQLLAVLVVGVVRVDLDLALPPPDERLDAERVVGVEVRDDDGLDRLAVEDRPEGGHHLVGGLHALEGVDQDAAVLALDEDAVGEAEADGNVDPGGDLDDLLVVKLNVNILFTQKIRVQPRSQIWCSLLDNGCIRKKQDKYRVTIQVVL